MALQAESDAVDFGFGDIKVVKGWWVMGDGWWVKSFFIYLPSLVSLITLKEYRDG
jgi:hypothetical protein